MGMNNSYQYHVYNEHMNFIVSVPKKDDEYAERFAKNVAIDFYEYTEEQVENVNVEFIVSFWMESTINLNKLNKPFNLNDHILTDKEMGTDFKTQLKIMEGEN